MSTDRIQELAEKIRHHQDLYHNGEAEISNEEYDALEDELRELAPEHPVLNRIGASPEESGWKKMEHSIPMGSLNKVNDPNELAEWQTDACSKAGVRPQLRDEELFYWSEKLDGISIALYYEDGKLQHAVTRGDGEVGEDIMANAVMMKGVLRELPEDYTGGIRGEVILPFDLYHEHLSDYSNPRNAASGIARLEDRGKASNCRHLTVKAFECFFQNGPKLETEFEKFHFLQNLGFKTPNHGGPFTIDQIADLYQRYEDDLRGELNYDIDGLVVRFNKLEDYESAGHKSGKPHGAIALKFASETAVTTLRNVRWQVGNTGRVTPVGEFDPVDLFGAQVEKASLYNCAEIERLNLNVGDEVLVERANDVIPKILEVTEKRNKGTVDVPEECPECAGELEFDGEHLVCDSIECEAQTTGKLKAWISALGILDWGSFVLRKVVEEGLVETIPDLYELEKEELAQLRDKGDKKLGMKTASKLVDKLHDDKNTTMMLDDFFGGLRIPLCRQKTFQMLMEAGYDSVEDVMDLSKAELKRVKGIGSKKAEAVHEGLSARENVIEELLNWVDIEDSSGGLEGLNICITGSHSKTRSEMKNDIKEAGGQYKGMSKKVDYLVASDPNSGSSKLKKAEKYDIPVISEDELYSKM
jgi:DNA ligase (NAD+)